MNRFFKLIYFLLFSLQFELIYTKISDKRLCVDQECKEPISQGKTLLRYSSPDSQILSFGPNEDVIIYSKSAGSKLDLWGAEIKGKRGYVPKNLIRESKIFKQAKILVDTEFTNNTNINVVEQQVPLDDDKSSSDKQVKPDQVQKDIEVVDGTTIYLNPDSIVPTSTETPSVQPTAVPNIPQGTTEFIDINTSNNTAEPNNNNIQEQEKVGDNLDKAHDKIEEENDDEDDDEEDEDEEDDGTVEEEEEAEQSDKNIKVESTENVAVESDQNLGANQGGDGATETANKEVEETPKVEPLTTTTENRVDEIPTTEATPLQNDEPAVTQQITNPVQSENESKETLSSPQPDVVTATTESTVSVGNPVEVSTDNTQTVQSTESSNEEQSASTTVSAQEIPTLSTEAPAVGETAVPTEPPVVEATAVPTESPVVEVTTIPTEIEPPPAQPIDPINYEVTPNPIEINNLEEKKEGDNIPTISPLGSLFANQFNNINQNIDSNSNENNNADDNVVQNSPPPIQEEQTTTETNDFSFKEETTVEPVTENVQTESIPIEVNSVENETVADQQPLEEQQQQQEQPQQQMTDEIEKEESVTTETVLAVEEEKQEEAAPGIFSNMMSMFSFGGEENSNNQNDESNVNMEETESTSTSTSSDNQETESFVDSQEAEKVENLEVVENKIEEPPIEVLEKHEHSSPLIKEKDDFCYINSDSIECQQQQQPLEQQRKSEEQEQLYQNRYHQQQQELKEEDDSTMSFVELDWSKFNPNIAIYLTTTAISVLTLIFGYILIDKCRREGPLVAKINKLEKELLIILKENELLKEGGGNGDKNIIQYDDDEKNQLKQELAQLLNIKSALEEQVQSLEKELENSTEVGLELNRMLSEILSSQSGSDVIKANVEHLQRQLIEQQSTINSVNETLALTNMENHELKLEVELNHKKVIDLQSELDKMCLNILKIEEEKDLQQNLLESEVTKYKQLYEDINKKIEIDQNELKNQIVTLEKQLQNTNRELELKTQELNILRNNIQELNNVNCNENTIKSLLAVTDIKAELELLKNENKRFHENLEQQKQTKQILEKQLQAAMQEAHSLRDKYDEADKLKVEAQTKLEVLSNYFKDKEAQLQKEISKHESLWVEKQGEATSTTERIQFLNEQLQNYKAQNESLKQEIISQEVELKSQISVLEKKAHENWVNCRQVERKLEDVKQEAQQLRHRLTLRERAIQEEKGQQRLQSPLEQNGDIPVDSSTSPLLFNTRDHITKSPPLPGLPPFLPPPPGVPFMPPPPLHGVPPFIPPPPALYPGDHRPPPLGRMSSPPINSRYSPSSRGYSPYRNSSSPSDSEYSEYPSHHRRPYSPPYNNRNDDRRDYKRPQPIRATDRNAKGAGSSGSGHSMESLERERSNRQQNKV